MTICVLQWQAREKLICFISILCLSRFFLFKHSKKFTRWNLYTIMDNKILRCKNPGLKNKTGKNFEREQFYNFHFGVQDTQTCTNTPTHKHTFTKARICFICLIAPEIHCSDKHTIWHLLLSQKNQIYCQNTRPCIRHNVGFGAGGGWGGGDWRVGNQVQRINFQIL